MYKGNLLLKLYSLYTGALRRSAKEMGICAACRPLLGIVTAIPQTNTVYYIIHPPICQESLFLR